MKSETSSIDLCFLIKEMQILVNAKIDSIYEPDHLLLQFHVPNQGHKFLKVTDSLIHFVDEKGEMPQKPSQFATILRKKLINTRLREIKQVGLERTVVFTLTSKDLQFKLVIELFGGGNIIILDESNKIIIAKKYVIFKDREIKRGLLYVFSSKNMLARDEFILALKNSDKENISKALAMDVGIGGFYSNELCERAKTSKDEKFSQKLAETLFNELTSLLGTDICPVKINNEVYPFIPVSLKHEKNTKDANKSDFDSFSLAISSINREKKKEITIKKNKEIEKVEKIVDMQQKKYDELMQKSQEMKKKGELIYENYSMVQEILLEIKKAKEKYSWDEIKAKLKDHKIIKSINEKEGKISVELK